MSRGQRDLAMFVVTGSPKADHQCDMALARSNRPIEQIVSYISHSFQMKVPG